MDFHLFFYYHTRKKKQGFLAILRGFLRPQKWQNLRSFRGLRPLDPYQGSALDLLRVTAPPQTPNCLK